MAKRPSKGTVKNVTIADMKKLGIYKPEYNRIIDIYAELVEQYGILMERFEASGHQYRVYTDQGSEKKAPIVATLESLRKDILAYSDRLCLNPKALETVTAEKASQSKLAAALKSLEKET